MGQQSSTNTSLRIHSKDYFLAVDKIHVMARIRGGSSGEDGDAAKSPLSVQSNKVTLYSTQKEAVPYTFDHVFDFHATNRNVVEKIQPIIQVAIDGTDVCIIADGASGAGKSFTMFESTDAIANSAASQIFAWVQDIQGKGHEPSVKLSVLEFYAHKLRDLLGKTHASPKISRTGNNKVTVTDGTVKTMSSSEDVTNTLQKAYSRRERAATKHNITSSRGHMVCMIKLAGARSHLSELCNSSLVLLDLAGSEDLGT